MIATVVPGGLSIFQKLEDQEKAHSNRYRTKNYAIKYFNKKDGTNMFPSDSFDDKWLSIARSFIDAVTNKYYMASLNTFWCRSSIVRYNENVLPVQDLQKKLIAIAIAVHFNYLNTSRLLRPVSLYVMTVR
jgi:hypothetical protein